MKTILLALLLPLALARAAENPAVEAINHLSLDVLRQTKGNALISAWSLQQNLVMVYAGARGQTQSEMAVALGYKGDAAALHAAFAELTQALAVAGEDVKSIRSANRLFAAKRIQFNADWLQLAKTSYHADPSPLDFADPRQAAKTINQWVGEQTEGKIPEIIPAGKLHEDTLLVLVNALYFGMSWEERFTKELTQDAPFFIAAGQSKTVPLMFKQHQQRYAHKEGIQIATIPFAGQTMQWVVLLPDNANELSTMEKSLTPALLAECATLPKTEVRLWLPRLKMQPPVVSVKDVLMNLGMKAAFAPAADLSGMMQNTDNAELDDVFHRCMMEMDEDGAKAASATATTIRPKNGVPHEVPHESVRADHPFILLIQHVPSGACLFIGRVADAAPEAPVKTEHKPSKR